ncbi:hypothetical protein GALMADRAFT_792794 [Galerina marginata CBS 339.88]|uniref:Uncharacterized protein n=1 Tax=Galerina marginata (strain CBS 339.88) TaxID=685588 RepID=A0A067SV70_GALM3|nr:hypothetical protein GALMADRAFT_792794 [Galerina marginata CBS 339.88]
MSSYFAVSLTWALWLGTLGSALTLPPHRTREGEGSIRLRDADPTYTNEFDALEASEGVTPYFPDVVEPEDVEDGVPVDEEAFWSKVFFTKVLMLAFALIIALLEVAHLCWTFAFHEPLSSHLVRVVFCLYMVGLSLWWTRTNGTSNHRRLQIHVVSLTTLAAALSILRSFAVTRIFSVLETHGAQHLDWIAGALYASLFLLAITIPQGPGLQYPLTYIYFPSPAETFTGSGSDSDGTKTENVCQSISAPLWRNLLFLYTQPVLELGKKLRNIDIGDLPVLPANMRATSNYARMRIGHQFATKDNFFNRLSNVGWRLGYRLVSLNVAAFTALFVLAVLTAVTNYGPAIFFQLFVKYLETDREKNDLRQGWTYVAGLTTASVVSVLISQQLWKVSTSDIEVRLRLQLNSMLFAKTLVRKDGASRSTLSTSNIDGTQVVETVDDFTSKTQVMNLMTTDVDRVGDFAWSIFALIDSPIEILVGLCFLYRLLGRSSILGISTFILFLPCNHFIGKVFLSTQEKLMKTRDERVSIMNEILGGIRMIKFMAWERSFIQRVEKIRAKELKCQRSTFVIEILWTLIWSASPIIVILVSFYDFAIVRQQELTPSIAFPSIIVFSAMKFALNALPAAFVRMMQSLVSLQRIAKYLDSPELPFVPQTSKSTISLENCTVAWPGEGSFSLSDVNISFPIGKISLICGKVGSGKSLLLYALLGEVEATCGTIKCPRTPFNFQSSTRTDSITDKDWIVDGICAYVPQTTWLRNASIRDNILFNLPYNRDRYKKTLEACALLSDLEILEDGDLTEIGERGVNLSGGQKARVSLARAVYSRASTLLLDDVLSAVDAQTANHIYHECLKGELMRGRSIILVSHHVHLCASGADYVVALENGRVNFAGSPDLFLASEFGNTLISSSPNFTTAPEANNQRMLADAVEQILNEEKDSGSQLSDHTVATTPTEEDDIPKKAPRRLIEEEKRAVGSIGRQVWFSYLKACGTNWYWTILFFFMVTAAVFPVLENAWLKHWAGREVSATVFLFHQDRTALFYISVYAGLSLLGLPMGAMRWFVLYTGSLQASNSLYSNLLEVVLFAKMRFHDTISRGRLLNRFGRDFEVTDSQLPFDLGHALALSLSALTSFVTIGIVAGYPFLFVLIVLGILYTKTAKIYGQTCRELRRLESITRSPLYSLYGETISGAAVMRSFGACSVSMRDMLRCLDIQTNPYYWIWNVNRWLNTRFSLLSSSIVGISAAICLITPSIGAPLAGFILAFASTINEDILYAVRYFVQLEQSMIAMERIQEFSVLEPEAPEFTDVIPAENWPTEGAVSFENLSVRYAPQLKDVLHDLTFSIKPKEKIGILGRTGSGKSTLAMSLFRFVEASSGQISIDGVDIAKIGLTSLRKALNIIPQDPTILSGTIRSTLDVFEEHSDAEIYDALRRVHLIHSNDDSSTKSLACNKFSNLDAVVSEAGDNFSAGEKQLLCMARSLLKGAKILVMDEATASVDYATDEHIGGVIRQEFAESTVITIAHRLRTVIDYDRVMVLEDGVVVEFEKPASLLNDPKSQFYALCKATGPEEFDVLRQLSGAGS